jgi:uncharacterized membrane protein (DUF485 family)
MTNEIEKVATKDDVALFHKDLVKAHNQIITWICIFGALQIATTFVVTFIILPR